MNQFFVILRAFLSLEVAVIVAVSLAAVNIISQTDPAHSERVASIGVLITVP